MRIDNLTFGELKLIESAVLKNYQKLMTTPIAEQLYIKYQSKEYYDVEKYAIDRMNSMPREDLDRKKYKAEKFLYFLGLKIHAILYNNKFHNLYDKTVFYEMCPEDIEISIDETTKHIFDTLSKISH